MISGVLLLILGLVVLAGLVLWKGERSTPVSDDTEGAG